MMADAADLLFEAVMLALMAPLAAALGYAVGCAIVHVLERLLD